MNEAGPATRAASLTVSDLFHRQVRHAAGRIAVESAAGTLSYAALGDRVARTAHWLAGLGIGRGQVIGLLSENRAEYIELILAAAGLGAVVACLNWRQADEELTHCIGLVAPRLLIASERFEPTARRAMPSRPTLLTLDAGHDRRLAGQPGGWRADPSVDDRCGLLILYTSGTTGMPKGALISQRAMVARGVIQTLDRGLDADDAFVAWTPMFHMGATDGALATLMRGGKLIVHDGFDAARLADCVKRESIGHLSVVPGVVDRVIARLRADEVVPRGIKAVGVMADLVPRAEIAELTTLLKAPYVNTFGSTETGSAPASRGVVAIGDRDTPLAKLQSSMCELRLADEEGRDVPDGTPGEALVRGPSLFSGYWNDAQATEEAFRGGWYHMGDLLVRDPDGRLQFVDRAKYLIKSGGENIYPAEIERILLATAGIADAVVVRRPDPRWGEVPVAFVVAADPAMTAERVLAACRGRIANYKLPRAVRFIDAGAMPRNVSGKIVRGELERRLQGGNE